MTGAERRPRILHIHAAFDRRVAELRCVRLINAFTQADHAVVSGDLVRRGAASLIDPKRTVSWPVFPSLAGKPLPGRLKRLAQAMAGYDLVCTYGWGAIDAAMAHTLFADVYKLAPLIHHEQGFDDDDTGTLKRTRTLYRRIALGRSAALVVPSRALERVALESWQQPRSRVRLIPDGIDSIAYARKPKRDAFPRLMKRPGELWVGTLSALRKGDDLPALVRAFAALPEPWQLVIAGDGPERAAILAQAETLGLEDRVHLPGAFADPARVIGLFDIFASSARVAQSPVSLVQAMAASLPVAAMRAGDVGSMIASDNGPFLAAPGDEAELGQSLQRLAADPALRRRLGEANRQKARAEYDEATMAERYGALYRAMIGLKKPA
ncbi:MAG TPA: glycosyltransferase family 4 protein [Croceibacterium sp.]|nr:glycosyltransferase family 4 protein [Croceibacterium sp.]